MIEDRVEVVLDDGRKVVATEVRPVTVVTFPAPRFPERMEPERVRVNEYRSLITGKVSYTVARSREP